MKQKKKLRDEIAVKQSLLPSIQAIETLCHDIGLHVTARAMNNAKTALGWELAGMLEQAGKAARGER